ncbi:IclR family transcriptional regulator [Nocardia asiatica]|uniref:IclR family transcriptional regulator n=1 Tax=Nocardia asiatica TaxID=209252 RepID=UPI00030C0D51|nr:IclR family transcriptional regulator [Nocardia asiatica]
MAGNTSRPGESTVDRVLAVLSAFDDRHRVLTLSELAARAGVPLSTAHRHVAAMVRGGALARRSDGRFTVGRLIWSLGLLAPAQTGLRQAAEPFLHDIYGATLATVHLAVREGEQVLYLDRLAGHASIPVVSRVGSKLPLHATGVGKVLLAHAPEDVRLRVLGSLRRITPYTVVQASRLQEQLDRVVRDGYATTAEEMTLGACSVAVPIRNESEVVAALGIVVSNLARDRRRLAAALQVAAQGISRTLGTEPR